MSTLKDNVEEGRYEIVVDGQIVWADYRSTPGRMVIDHVEAPVALRGSGAAGRLMEAVAAEARREGVKIVPLCGYAATWLRRHKHHADLIA